MVGNVDGRRCVLIDDMIDTAGTICAAAERLVEQGADRRLGDGHARRLSDPALDRLKVSPISRVVVTDTMPHPDGAPHRQDRGLSVAPLIADAIDAVFEDTSVSDIFGGHNLT